MDRQWYYPHHICTASDNHRLQSQQPSTSYIHKTKSNLSVYVSLCLMHIHNWSESRPNIGVRHPYTLWMLTGRLGSVHSLYTMLQNGGELRRAIWNYWVASTMEQVPQAWNWAPQAQGVTERHAPLLITTIFTFVWCHNAIMSSLWWQWGSTLTTRLTLDVCFDAIGCRTSDNSISKSATFATFTSASGLVLGASNNARRVGNTASAISSWLHLKHNHKEREHTTIYYKSLHNI